MEEFQTKKIEHAFKPILRVKNDHYTSPALLEFGGKSSLNLVRNLKKIQTQVDISPLSINDSKVSAKGSFEVSRVLSSHLRVGLAKNDVISEKQLPVSLEVEAEFKLRMSALNNHVKTYLGVSHSIDGWKWLLGFKIAGIKFKFPINIIGEENSASHDVATSVWDDVQNSLKVFAVFYLGSVLAKKYTER